MFHNYFSVSQQIFLNVCWVPGILFLTAMRGNKRFSFLCDRGKCVSEKLNKFHKVILLPGTNLAFILSLSGPEASAFKSWTMVPCRKEFLWEAYERGAFPKRSLILGGKVEFKNLLSANSVYCSFLHMRKDTEKDWAISLMFVGL